MSAFQQWVVVDLKVFRDQWANNRMALKFVVRPNGDGTYFHAFDITSFPSEFLVGASDNLGPLLDPLLGILYIDRDIPKPSPAEMARRMRREEALRFWHTTPSIKEPFETWWAQLVREGKT